MGHVSQSGMLISDGREKALGLGVAVIFITGSESPGLQVYFHSVTTLHNKTQRNHKPLNAIYKLDFWLNL